MEFNNNEPIYLQVIRDLKVKICSGEIAPGEKFVSVRDVAEKYGVNPNTAQRSLSKLEDEGFLYSNRTAGRFVTEDAKFLKEARVRLVKSEIENFLEQMIAIGLTKEEIITILKNEY